MYASGIAVLEVSDSLTLSGVNAMEPKTAIGYAVYSPDRDTFLGRNGVWYTDIRMATVYSEHKAAKLASGRTEVTFAKAIVEIRLTALPNSIEDAKKAVEKPAERPAEPTKPSPDKNPPVPPKAGTKAA